MALIKSKAQPTGEEACIVINNSFSSLEEFAPGAIQAVREKLTYENQEALQQIKQLRVSLSFAFRYKRFKQVQALKAQLADLEGATSVCWLRGTTFPTGHLGLVREALAAGKWDYNVLDLRENTAPKVVYEWAAPPLEPRYFQKEMLALGVAAHRGVFVSAVGSGKTYTAQLLIHALKVPVLVVVPSKDLAVQTYEEYSHAFGEKVVALIGSSGKGQSSKPVRICTVQTLTALRKKEALGPLLKGLGMLIIDELHHAGSASYTELLPHIDHIYYRFGFTGTFLRNDSKTLDMWGFLSTILYRYTASQATREGFLTPLKVVVHEIDGIKTNNYQKEYQKNYCGNPEFLSAIRDILIKNEAKDSQVLILVGRKEASGKIIHEYLKTLGIENAYIDGDSDKAIKHRAIADFNSKKLRVLIGSSVIGEGINIKSTDDLIMGQGGKSEVAVTQATGRAVRLYPGKTVARLHDFAFKNTKYLLRHCEARLIIYRDTFNAEITQ